MSCSIDDEEACLTKEELAALTHILQQAHRKLPPPSFSSAAATPLPLWQRVAISTVRRVEFDEDDQRQANTAQAKLEKELVKYHANVHAREERIRRQQRESRAQYGTRLAAAAQRFWVRRGDEFQQMVQVEFDLLKRHRDKRRQEDLLRETEELTRKLLDSILADKDKSLLSVHTSNSDTGDEVQHHHAHGMVTRLSRSGTDGSAEMEASLSLLDTQDGRRPLRHYQRSALHWMIHLFESKLNGVLADEMGLGKTVQTIALLCYYAQYKNDWGPHLIVVPTTVVLNWKAELHRWAPGLKVLTYIGSQKERMRLRKGWTREDAFHICVTSYNLVVQDRSVFRKRAWGFLVLDEAHQVKNFMSKKWQSLFDLQTEYRLLLTGTPLQNSIMELWSLFHFLLPFASAFRSNDEFKEWFSNPMDDMITGRSLLNEDIVRRLQALLRPFMLRRLKRDVETQLPTKTERVVLCHLSRRQRSLYDDYMQLAETKERLRGGGTGGVLHVLLGLRKVCDHPDLFEERPTVSPLALGRFAMIVMPVPRRVLLRDNDYRGCYRFPRFTSLEIVDLNEDCCAGKADSDSVEERQQPSRGLLLPPSKEEENECFAWLPCHFTRLSFHVGTPVATVVSMTLSHDAWAEERHDSRKFTESPALRALDADLRRRRDEFAVKKSSVPPLSSQDTSYLAACRMLVGAAAYAAAVIREGYSAAHRIQRERLVHERCASVYYAVPQALQLLSSFKSTRIQTAFADLCPTVAERAETVTPVVVRVAVYVPAALAVFAPQLHCALPLHVRDPFTPLTRASLAPLLGYAQRAREAITGDRGWRRGVFDGSTFLSELWPMQVRRCFSFPDKRLVIHDCGKLQFLAVALKEMRQAGHRMLIFTQFVHMLNILERFLALTGVTYLRLDGSTRAELRQIMVDRFNEDSRITCMILSTRSGGIGLNLTGADTVIFYDSDWNPTMDLQAQDRCHRIGQTRPVTIYRLISEHTVEEAILQKARERKKLNNVVIRGGQFHSIAGIGEEYDDAAAAFAALSDPVNLRSFFHDYDEDVTLPTMAGETGEKRESAARGSPVDFLAEMARVEDAEDREAAVELKRELLQRATDDAVEQDGDEDDHNCGNGSCDDMDVTASGGEASEIAALAASRKVALRRQSEALNRILSARNVGDTPDGHPELVAADLMPIVRKRQRALLAKCRSPLDQLLTAQYGLSSESDAWSRYARLRDEYAAKLIGGGGDALGRGDGGESDAGYAFPPYRPRFELPSA